LTALEVDRVIRAPIEEVFAALTDPDVMAQWFFHEVGGSAEIEMEPIVGGAYSILMRGSEGSELSATGEFLAVVHPTRLVFTWNTYLTTDATVTIELRELGDTTVLQLRHELPTELHEPHRIAWVAVLANLDTMLA
jgi:uncharacterized protein YndB with AHSA1/START domain